MVEQSDQGREVFVFQVNTGAGVQEVVSIVHPGTVFEHGLPTEAIVGILRSGPPGDHQITPERFQENPAFVRHLQELIAARIHEVDGIQQAARQHGDGWVYLIDARAQFGGKVPPTDVIGAVEVEDGTLVADSYRPNPNHRLLTEDGFFELPAELEVILRTDLDTRRTRPE